MARAVTWSGRARSDLRTAVEYIKRGSPASAARFLQQALRASRSLGQFPERGSAVVDLEEAGVRQLLIGRYRMLYETQADTVWILRVVHGSRDLLLALGRRTREEVEGEGG